MAYTMKSIFILIASVAFVFMLFVIPNTSFAQTATSTGSTTFGLECSIVPWKFDMGACVALAGYYLFWYPTSLLLMLAASIFDVVATWSFDASILRSSMVSDAWGMIRNLANLGLILALLYISIATILQLGGVQLKKAVANVIIIALLINFSFFITRVVIDASNILASSLYSRIGAPDSSVSVSGTTSVGGTDVKSISTRIVAAFDPQKMLTKDVIAAWKDARDGLSSLFFVFLFTAIINVIAAYIFLKAGLLLIGRVVMFVFLVVSSPLAFVAWALPGGGGGFDKKWWGSLIDQALVAPVFFLFLYVITSVYSSSLLTGIVGSATGQGFMAFLVNIALHFVVIIVALFIAVSVTTKLSGAAGSYATKIGGAVVGGAVLGGGAMIARNTIGRGAARLAEKVQDSQWAKNNPSLGRYTKAGLDATAGASFDARGVKGIDGLGKPSKGGYMGGVKRSQESKEKYAKSVVGGKRGDVLVTPEQFAKYGTDKEKASYSEGQAKYVAAVQAHPTQMKAYEEAMKNHQEKTKTYEKEMMEFSSLPQAIQQKRTAEGRAPVKPIAPTKPKEPERPSIPLNARERLARQYEESKFRSTRLAAENARKGKGGKKSVPEVLTELLEEQGEIKGDEGGGSPAPKEGKSNEA